MEFKSMLRRVAGAGAALAAVGAMLMAPASASAAPGPQLQARGTIVNIKHASSRQCLIANGKYEVLLGSCIGTNDEKWDNFTTGNVGRYRNVQFNACLASDGAKVFLMDKCDTPSSEWTTDSSSPTYIRHGRETSKCLNTNSGATGKFAYLITCGESTRWSVLAGS